MENIIKKTNIGIAVQEAISELGLERERTKIMSYLQKAFEEKFEEFKKTLTTNNGSLKGHYVADNEFPIGEHDKQQYFRSIAFQAKISGVPLTTNTSGEKRPFTLIEGYSRNDESKKRQYSKAHSKSEKKSTETSGKKMQKKK
jgi:hypothetical protein